MKKRHIALLVLLALVLTCGLVSAAAADTIPTITPGSNGFTISRTDGQANGLYIILALTGNYSTVKEAKDAIAAGSISYIDQTMADVSGAFSFSDFWPKAGGIHTVLLAGTGLAEPKIICYLNENSGAAVGSYYIAGRFECPAAANGGTFKVSLTNGSGYSQQVDSGYAGVFTFEVPAGTYTLTVKPTAYLSYTLTDIQVVNSNILLPNSILLRGGDFDESGQVTPTDLSNFLNVLNTTVSGGTDAKYDLNNDGEINMGDLSAQLSNMLKQNESEVWQ